MERITYGAPRLVDWVAQIKVGAASVRVHFTGGALTAYGVTPAEYTTDSEFMQKVIERSAYFKDGRIVVMQRVEIPDAPKPVSAVVVQPTEQAATLEQAKAATATEATAEAATPTIVEVGCLQDAQAYLQEHFNIYSYKVRSYKAAQRAASDNGVKFTGPGFDAPTGEKTGSDTEEE